MLGSQEMAYALSFAFYNQPDGELLKAAGDGKLSSREQGVGSICGLKLRVIRQACRSALFLWFEEMGCVPYGIVPKVRIKYCSCLRVVRRRGRDGAWRKSWLDFQAGWIPRRRRHC
jgi:hypothetical protein